MKPPASTGLGAAAALALLALLTGCGQGRVYPLSADAARSALVGTTIPDIAFGKSAHSGPGEATADLMTTMFDQTDSSQAEALAKAEQKMMARPDEYSHPYYWAPFTIVGDGARSMPKPPSTPAQTTPAA